MGDVSLRNVHICQRIFDIEVHHGTLQIHVVIRENGQIILDEPVDCSGVLSVNFSEISEGNDNGYRKD